MKTKIGIAIILIAAIAVGAYALTATTSSNTNNGIVAAATDQDTKLDIHNNNPNVWAHVDLVFNATSKNGTTQTWYVEAFAQPGGNITIDLSKLLGYDNQKLPPMNITVTSWKGIYNNTTGGTGDLDFYLQGWSGATPTNSDQKYTITYPGLPLGPLPSQIKTSTVLTSTNLSQVEIDDDTYEVLFEQETINIDANGKVTIIITTPPTLCTLLS